MAPVLEVALVVQNLDGFPKVVLFGRSVGKKLARFGPE